MLKYISIQLLYSFVLHLTIRESWKNCKSRSYGFRIFSRRPLFTHVRQLKEIFTEIDSATFPDVIRLRGKIGFQKLHCIPSASESCTFHL